MIEINPNHYNVYTDYRIAIYDINRKVFDKIDVMKANNLYLVKEDYILNNLADFKYKIQVKNNKKWTDATKYLKFYDDTILEKVFTDKIQLTEKEYNEILERYWSSTSDNYTDEIKTAFSQSMRRMWLSPTSTFDNLLTLIKLSKQTDIAIPLLWKNIILYIEELFNFNEHLNELEISDLNYSDLTNIDDFKKKKLKEYIKSRISHLDKINLEFSSLLVGLFYSYIGNREYASNAIKEAHKFNEKYISKMKIDIGSYTYNEIKDLEYNPIVQFTDDIQVNNNITILISLDSKFLKYYGPQLFYTIISLKEYHFHFHLVDDDNIVKQAVTKAKKVFREMINFMSPEKDVVEPTFSYESLPSFVKDIKTYYACSRFIIANEILQTFNNDILIIDADLYIFDNLKLYLSKIEKFDISLDFSKTLHSLYPWRRIMAGNVFFKHNKYSLSFLSLVKNYIVNNLSNENTWTLDQNALSYAYEEIYNIHPNINIGSSSSYYTPFYQPPIRRTIERK